MKAFPAETFLPKVQMEYNAGPKVLPRNVEMERRRRVYKSLKIEDALEAEGVKSHDMLPPEKICALLSYDEKYNLYSKANYLPLELFDDEEYDCRTADEWINLGIIDGVRYPLPATVFVEKIIHKERIFDRDDKTLSNLFSWFPAAITDYDNKRKLWTVLTLDALKRKFLLPRIYIRFFGEDPRKFAQRIANAVKQRQIAEISIRYHFYLDCMLVDGMSTLDEKQQDIIILSATRQGSIKCESKHLFSLMDEVVLEYRRVMCDLMWRPLIEKQPEMFNFIMWKEINDIREFDAPKTGKICTEMEDFTKTKNFFHWIVLYVVPEVHEAMQCVATECIHVSNMNLFIPNYGKSIYLSEFKSQQHQETGTVIKYLKETWVEKITQSVRLCLRDIGKGWFDLEQRRHDVYNVMKLKRFMDLIAYRMQNALRNLVEKSIALYLEMLETPALCTLNIDENFTWGDDLVNTQFKSPVNPIFNIDLTMNDKTAYYLTDLELFEEVIIGLLDNSLSQCHEIKQVHPLLLLFLKFPKDLYLSSVGLLEKQVCEVRDRLRTAYRKSVISLKAYANEYQQYLGIYKLNVEKYVEDFKKADHTVVEIKDEISFHFKMKSILESTLPKDIVIGSFRVNVRPLRQFLIQKRQNCCTQLLVMFTESLRAQIDIVLSDYVQIRTRLKAAPHNIEHLFEEQDWMETIPLIVKAIDKIVQKLKHEYDILDHFWWNLSDQDFEAKWQAISFPRQIQLHIEETRERFTNEYEKFHKAQIQDEILLSERINTLVGNVSNVALQTDINRILEMAIEVKRIWKMIKDCQESSLLLNERQKLFSMSVVPFEQLSKLMREFEPYQILWITASEIAAIALTIRDQIEAFKPYIGIIQALRDPGMKTRHFEELTKQIGIQMELTPTLTFKSLLFLGVMKYEDTVKTVAEAAAKEYLIESAMDKMITEWKTITMDILPYKNTGTYIIKISDEITTLLDDDILNTQHLSFSPFKAAFESQIDEWEAKLRLIQEVIALWTEIIITCADKILLESLKECLLILETVQKSLSDYLETKRMIFPRFFFLSDDELLEIIIQSKHVQAIQPYLKKCFENMNELRFEHDLRITRMYSAEYEEVALRPSIYPEGNVENWLGQVEDTMRNTLRELISEALEMVETTSRKQWMYMWPGQVVLCGSQTYWTAHVEEGIRNNTLSDYHSLMLSHLEILLKLIRGPQTEIQRLMLEAVITIEVHAKDVLYKLIQQKITQVNDFEWISQLRYYWIDNKDLKIRAVNAEFPYEYEYLGNNGRLVITPLTDRCYLTLTGALHLKFGGAPAGPAGTGKTETTKDLAKAFAIQCVVFNCSDQLNFRSMGKFFKGLASAGAWACFDEFNRIDIEVLSVVAQQIMTIQKAQHVGASV
ncbi:dynein heavy chain axonemal [Lasius niger]|uniref:Dynein heavy chain axonemal n=1 Tax=Lasius niger TaxID=67767 RepID=A0A0J7KYK8_LASNI|nr:dynein heavy chain axonemal [Lasius niger]